MIIDRLFGKSRGAQDEPQTPPPAPAQAPPQTQAQAPSAVASDPRAEQKSGARQSKPQGPGSPAPEERPVPVRRAEPPVAGAQAARPRAAVEPVAPRKSTASAVMPAAAAAQRSDPTYEEIAARAYELWLAQGCPTGAEHQNWIDAERTLRLERKGR